MMWNGFGGWGMGLMFLSWLGFWALLVGGAVLLWRVVPRHRATNDAEPDPQRLLGERYARGEIDDAEYQHRRTVLHR